MKNSGTNKDLEMKNSGTNFLIAILVVFIYPMFTNKTECSKDLLISDFTYKWGQNFGGFRLDRAVNICNSSWYRV